jgi:hypothetical protein
MKYQAENLVLFSGHNHFRPQFPLAPVGVSINVDAIVSTECLDGSLNLTTTS